MQDGELSERVLGLKRPWKVSPVDLRIEESKGTVTVSHDPTAPVATPGYLWVGCDDAGRVDESARAPLRSPEDVAMPT